MRSTNKVILFAQTTAGKSVHRRPVAVFANTRTAMAHKSRLADAQKTGDPEKVKALDPGVHLTEDGKLHDDSKWAIMEVPYEPAGVVSESAEDTFTF